jgi:hypothetical protein
MPPKVRGKLTGKKSVDENKNKKSIVKVVPDDYCAAGSSDPSCNNYSCMDKSQVENQVNIPYSSVITLLLFSLISFLCCVWLYLSCVV